MHALAMIIIIVMTAQGRSQTFETGVSAEKSAAR